MKTIFRTILLMLLMLVGGTHVNAQAGPSSFTWPTPTTTGQLGKTVSFINGPIPSNVSVSYVVAGTAPSVCTFRVEGSPDDVNWVTISSSSVSCVSSGMVSITNSPVNYLRVNVLSYTTTGTVTFTLTSSIAGATGPTGATGAAGAGACLNWRSAWVASTSYAVGDCYYASGYSYEVKTAYTSGASFGSTDTTDSTAYAVAGATLSGTPGLPLQYTGTNGATVDPTQGAYVSASQSSINSVIATFESPAVLTLQPFLGFTAVWAHGDSITGTYCTEYTCYVQQAANALGVSLTNYAVGGDEACDQVKHAFNEDTPTLTDNTLRTLMLGINDADYLGLGAGQATSQTCMLALETYIGIPSAYKVAMGSQTPASGWSTDSTYTEMTGLTTTGTTAQTISFTEPTTPVQPEMFLWYRIFDASSGTTGGRATVTYGSNNWYISAISPYPMNTPNGATDSIGVLDMGTASGAAGTKTITVTPNNSGGTVSILGVGFGPNPTQVTNVAITSNVVTFTTTTNTLVAGQKLVATGMYEVPAMNGAPFTVLSAGLSSTSFEANVPTGYGIPSTFTSTAESPYAAMYNAFPYVKVAGATRNSMVGYFNHQTTQAYYDLQALNVKTLRGEGFFNFHWWNSRACLLGSLFDMQGGQGAHHPTQPGHNELASCLMGEATEPQVPAPVDTTLAVNRAITSTTNCQISPTDQHIIFNVSTAMSCALPPPSNPIINTSATGYPSFAKRIELENSSAVAITLTGNINESGSAVNLVLQAGQSCSITQGYFSRWSALGSCGPLDISQLSTVNIHPGAPYTYLSTDQVLDLYPAGVMTLPSTTSPGKLYYVRNDSTGNVTYSGGNYAAVLPPAGGELLAQVNSSTWGTFGFYNPGNYLNCTAVSAGTYTLLYTDPCVYFSGSGTLTLTLPTTFVAYKTIPVFSPSGTIVFTGAAAGNANAQAVRAGQMGALIGYGVGDWNLAVEGPGIRTVNIGTAIASATTIAPFTAVVHITGTTTITTITAPGGCTTSGTGCQEVLIPDGLWSTATGGNIAIASTAVVSKAMTMTYDPGTSLWFPSY